MEGRTQYSWIWTTASPPPLSFLLTTTPNDVPQINNVPRADNVPQVNNIPQTDDIPQANDVPQAAAPASASLFSPSIILATNSTNSNVISQDFERSRWAKCQARVEQYEEEVELTVEEMGRTLRYFKWKQDWWLSYTPEDTKSNTPANIHSGLHAYAYQQSHLYDDLITLFFSHWRLYLST